MRFLSIRADERGGAFLHYLEKLRDAALRCLVCMHEFVKQIEWWPRDAFRGRSNVFESSGEKDGHTYIDIEKQSVPDDFIVCDVCNDDIDEFPCAVVGGYALCSKCRKNWAIEQGDTEYYETYAYNVGEEPPKPKINFGGRKQ